MELDVPDDSYVSEDLWEQGDNIPEDMRKEIGAPLLSAVF
jgi:hypothetical protein